MPAKITYPIPTSKAEEITSVITQVVRDEVANQYVITSNDVFNHCIFLALENKEKLEEMKRILHDELPEDNYFVLKYVIHFLTDVSFIDQSFVIYSP